MDKVSEPQQANVISELSSAPAGGAGDKGGRTARRWTISLAFLVVAIVVQALIFRHSFLKYIAPYYPINNDQLFSYSWAYYAHYHLLAEGWKWLASDPTISTTAGFMKGWLVQTLAVAFTFIFGPDRLAVGFVNFAFFAIAELAIFCVLLARRGLTPALTFLGFFLLCGTHYYHSGSMFDVRLDYGGMTMMGVTFASALAFLETGSTWAFVLSALALVLAVGTRSILLVYWIGGLSLSLAIAAGAAFSLKERRPALRTLALRSGQLLFLAVVVFVAYVAAFWTEFRNYYIRCKADGEDLMRLRENSVKTIVDRFLYYPRSFSDHFSVPIVVAILVAAAARLTSSIAPIALFVRRQFREKGDSQPGSDRAGLKRASPGEKRDSLATLTVLFFSIAVTVYACATYYVPTPVVIGVLAVPLSVMLSAWVSRFTSSFWSEKVSIVVAIALVALGMARYVKEFTRPTYISQPNHLLTDAVNQTMETICQAVDERAPRSTTVFWCLVHDGLNQEYLKIYFAENEHKLWPDNLVQSLVPAYPPSSLTQIEDKVAAADLVVVPIELPPLPASQFEYDGSRSVRRYLPEILPVLRTDFRQVLKTIFFQAPSSPPGQLGVFERIR